MKLVTRQQKIRPLHHTRCSECKSDVIDIENCYGFQSRRKTRH